jgi:predicted permease
VFSLVDGILLKDMAYERPGELVTIWGTWPEWRDDPLLQEAWDKIGLTWDDYTTLRDETRAFSGIGAHRSGTLTLTGAGDAVRLESGEATATLFPLLGIRPVLGRTFLPGEEGPGAPRLAVLGYELWQTRFGGDSTVVGRSVSLNGEPFEVIGVLPRGVRIHSTLYNLFNSSIDAGERAIWIPANWNRPEGNGSRDLEALGRVRPGVSTEEALAEVGTILKPTGRHEGTVFRLTPPREEVVAGYRSPLLLLLGASGLLLLIACGNAATLLLGEAIDRRGEISTRVALGAGRRRIAQQLLTESLILGLAGSLVGMVLTPLGVRAFLALGPALPRLQNVEINQGGLLAAVITGMACALLFGFAPALLQHKHSIHALLQKEGRGRLGGGGKAQTVLLAGELALTMVLLVSSGLLSRSLGELGRVEPGFRAQGVATIRAQIPSGHFDADRELQREGVQLFRSQALERIRSLPEILAAGAIDGLPFPGLISGSTFIVGVTGPDGGEEITARDHNVTPGYFETLGIPLLAGRDFTEADAEGGYERGTASGGVAVINETMARRYWPDQSPIGQIIGSGPNPHRIVGVVGDVRERHLSEEPLPMVYRPASISAGSFSIVARVSGSPEALVPRLREAVRAVDPEIPLTQETTMASLVAESSGAERFRAFLVSVFGVLATLLAMVGVFGVTARSVAHRTREMGIRMALGAESGSLIRSAAFRTLWAGAVGIALGLVGALWVTRLLTTFLFGTAAWDGWTYSGAVLLLGALCAAAAALAARRVTRVEPMRVLREE